MDFFDFVQSFQVSFFFAEKWCVVSGDGQKKVNLIVYRPAQTIS